MTKALTYIEIDVPFCSLTYGSSPCTATLAGPNPTGEIKCFNTPKTCQDRANYDDAPVTLRFAQDVGYLEEAGIDCIPSVTNINYTPATVSLGKDLGTRESLAVTFKDHAWPDTAPGFDKYRTERPYDPAKQGTFWGKFRARQPFLRGRALRMIRGFVGQALGDMEVRHLLVDTFNHNAETGAYSITAKDALKFADDERAQAPVLTNGFLSAAIAATDLALQLQPVGIGNEEYPVTGHVAVGGKEVCAFARDLTAGNDANTKLLLHMDGAQNSVEFPDASTSSKTPNLVSGTARVDGAQLKFGTGSLIISGGLAYITYADHADWTPSGDFTFDMWAQFSALNSTNTLFCHFTNGSNRYALSADASGALNFVVVSSGSTIVTMTSANGAVAVDGLFHHLAVIRNGNVWRITVDGVQVATVTDSDAIPNFRSEFRVATDHNASNGFRGWLDEFRVSHVARWTAFPFTPPIAAYQPSADYLNLTRAQMNTEAIDHAAGDRAQLVLRYIGQDVADIIRDLLVTYAGVPDSYIPLATWKTETASFLNRVFTADIAEPVGVKTLMAELIEDAALSVWWDNVAQQIRLRVLRAISTDAALFDQDSYLSGSFGTTEQPKTRVSQIWRYFAKRNPLEGQDDPDNYRSVAATVDLEAEADYGSSVIKKIFARWVPFGGRNVADRANALYLSRYRDPPRRVKFATMRTDDLIQPELGQGYRIAGLGLQDETGAAVNAPIQITRLSPGEARFEIEAEEMLVASTDADDLINRVIVIDAGAFNFDMRAVHDTLYPAPTDDDVGNGVNLICYVETGVVVGSADPEIAAFVVGLWPTGFPITLVVNGRIQGAGGRGGRRSGDSSGQAGGTALYTRHDIDLEVAAGEIWGGGGGGGQGSSTLTTNTRLPGSGGGGGAGQVPGAGGGTQTLTNPSGSTTGEPGHAGTATAGGAPGLIDFDGGAGGGPGLAGAAGQSGGASAAGSGGAAGNAIDGVSYITVTVGPGDRRGPEIN